MAKKILLIEDHSDVRETTADILEVAGYEVLMATDGKTGVEQALREKPDLIICDIMMPVMDGYGVLHLLSKNEDMARVPFIFLTAKSERDDQRKGMAMGADDYITKPFNVIDLLGAIETRIRKAELMRKEYATSLSGIGEFLEDVSKLTPQAFSSQKESRTYRKKEVLYRPGMYPKGVYFLSSGAIKTFRTNEQGKEYITAICRAGDFFGYNALLDNSVLQEGAITLEDSEICVIPKEEFISLLHKNPQISRTFIKLMSNRLLEKENELIKLAYNSVRKRVAEALLRLSGEAKEPGSPGMSVARDDIASLAGAALETTVRTLSDFRREGLIDIQSNKIILLKREQLARLKN